MKNLTINGFASYEPPALVSKATYIDGKLTANVATFTTPIPALPTLTDGIKDLEESIENADGGDHIMIAIRNDKQAYLVDVLQQLGTYVNNRANGDRTIARLSGYDVRKENEPRLLQPITVAPRATRSTTLGSVDAAVKSQKAASRGANWYITTDATKPLSAWTKFDNQTARITFIDLVPGQKYTVCAELLGPRQQRQLSPQATVVA
jgi:hypothetical protein